MGVQQALGLTRADIERLAASAFTASFVAEEERRARLQELHE